MNLRQMAENKVSIAFEDNNDRKEFMDWYWKNGGCNENGRDVYLPIECKGVNLWIYDDNGYTPEDYNKILYNWNSMATTTWKSLRPKSKSYELIITNTNKVIILDKENGRRGISKCHPDDEFDIVKGFDLAWSRLKGIEPHKSREDIINEEYGVNDEFKPSNKNGNPLNGVSKTPYLDQLTEIAMEKFKEALTAIKDRIKEQEEPKLYDSFGEELKEGDRVVWISGDFKEYNTIVRNDRGIYSNGMRFSHTSWNNGGKFDSKDTIYKDWIVVKC